MTPSVETGAWGAVIAFITGVCLVLANRYAGSANAKQRANDHADDTAVGGFVELTRELRTSVRDLRERVETLEHRDAERSQQLDRITRLEEDTRRRYLAAVRYIRDLWQWAAEVTPSVPPETRRPPPPPLDLQTRLDEGE